jgi:hypothetical protein
MQHPLYLLGCTPPSSTFIESFISFDFLLHKMFPHLLGPRSFDSPKRLLARKQASLPIIFGGIEVILTSTITLTTYFGNWVFVVSVIVARFMVDQRPFLLQTLAQIDNNIFFPATLQGGM